MRTFLLCWMAALAFDAGASPDAFNLRPGETVERSLEAGRRHVYEVDLTPGPWRFNVDQQGIDVTLEVNGPGGERLLTVDSPFDRQGPETALIEVETAGVYRVTVRSREPTATGGSTTIRIDRLTPEPRRLVAERTVTEASRLYLEASSHLSPSGGTQDAWRQAMDAYSTAFETFRDLGLELEAAHALYANAVIHRLAQENERALELDREVLLLFRGLGNHVFLANTVNEMGLNQWLLGDTAKARVSFGRALEYQRRAGHRWGEAVASANLCLMDLVAGDLRAGAECYEQAVPLLDEVRATDLAATALSNAGRAHDLMGEPEKALAAYSAALKQVRALGDRTKEARILNNLGVLRRELGELQAALESYGGALAIFQEHGNRRWQARVLGNVGLVYGGLNRQGQARAHFRQALSLWDELGDPRGQATALSNLGWAHRELGEPREALGDFERALDLWREAGARREEAQTFAHIGRVHLDLEEPLRAADWLTRAVTLLRKIGDLTGELDALGSQGTAYEALGRPAAAVASFTRALELSRDLGSRAGEAWSHFLLARTLRHVPPRETREPSRTASNPSTSARARAHVEAAIEIVESGRDRIRPPTLRASYASRFHGLYELYIDLLIDAHRDDPGAGHGLAALEVSERARARTLLELMLASGTDPYAGADPELLARRKSLLRRLGAKADRASRPSVDATRRGALEAEQSAILSELDLLEARLRALPEGDDLAQTSPAMRRPVTAAEIQNLLDGDTMLLVYALGKERSFVWQVTTANIQVHQLPARREIETAARRVHESLRRFDASERRRDAEQSAALGHLLLGPVADRFKSQGQHGLRRLVIVPDGALHYVPFEALRLPSAGDDDTDHRTVLETFEVAYLPSASVLAAQRRAAPNRAPAPRALAVLADPVFDRRDPRLAGTVTEAGISEPTPADVAPTRSGRATHSSLDETRFERLPATRQEAEALAALAAPGEVLAAFDFEANRERVLGDRLRSYRFIHFATHGVIDTETPALSGLVLSLRDKQGRPREGFLRLHDLYGLQLEAELVVLSGCRTALGTHMRGEGLWGLTRGFLSAGARRVLASLWQVEDRATAELMKRFYDAMWTAGLPPAAALRQAKLSVSRERRWRDPHFWAGFVLEGDWR